MEPKLPGCFHLKYLFVIKSKCNTSEIKQDHHDVSLRKKTFIHATETYNSSFFKNVLLHHNHFIFQTTNFAAGINFDLKLILMLYAIPHIQIIQTEKSKSISVILKPATLLKKILCHRSFLVNFVMRFLRIVCLQNSSGRLLLKIPFTRELKLSPQSERLDQRTF